MPYIANRSGICDYMVPVTASDSANLSTPNARCVGLYVTTNGNLSLLYLGRESETPHVVAVPDNFVLPAAVSRVRATGTTATGIHAMMVNG